MHTDNKYISNVSDFLEWVSVCHNVDVGPQNKFSFFYDNIYFRGHASTSWELVPSLFRSVGRIYDEHGMLQRANNMLWSELNDCRTDMEKLVRLQHYGLRTRLLDVTYNPLIALYFACQNPINNSDSKEGIVYCGYNNDTDVKIGAAIAEYIFGYDTINIDEKELDRICLKYSITKDLMDKIHIVNPPYNSQRIIMQNGAFIISPLVQSNVAPPFNYANQAYIKKRMETAFEKSVTISNDYKQSILNELDSLGLNKATIFTDISSKLEYINEKEEKGFTTIDLS